MTLKSNKNEPAVILESVNSVRTALSDLYLEQLLQNKPKSDKVRCRVFFFTSFCPPDFGVHVCFREARDGAHDRCLFLGKISKNRPSCVFIVQLTATECVDLLNKELDM